MPKICAILMGVLLRNRDILLRMPAMGHSDIVIFSLHFRIWPIENGGPIKKGFAKLSAVFIC
jgi:hypothetical protein